MRTVEEIKSALEHNRWCIATEDLKYLTDKAEAENEFYETMKRIENHHLSCLKDLEAKRDALLNELDVADEAGIGGDR